MPPSGSFGRPRLLVKFSDTLSVPGAGGLSAWLDAHTHQGWGVLQAAHTGLHANVAFENTTNIEKLVARAQNADPNYDPPKFTNFVYLDGPAGTPFLRIARAVRQWPLIETVFLDIPARDPFVLPENDPKHVEQGHLAGELTELQNNEGTFRGIDARYAWRFRGGDGDGVQIADLERGWRRNHPDLVNRLGGATIHFGLTLGPQFIDARKHGTAVAGLLCAEDSGVGVVGVVPRLSGLHLVSTVTALETNTQGEQRDIAGAVAEAGTLLAPGDVILIEGLVLYVPDDGTFNDGAIDALLAAGAVQLPAEANPLTYAAIVAAKTAEFVVVSAAGHNDMGGVDIDAELTAAGAGWGNNGAASILVGGAYENDPHHRVGPTNYGSSVSCWAWANRAMTTLFDVDKHGNVKDGYQNFGGTSSAAAIIAGAAAAVQAMHVKEYEAVLTQDELRAIFTNPAYGYRATPSMATGGLSSTLEPIGIMPNLRRIVDTELQLPFPWVRESPGDTGSGLAPPLHRSPDIIVRNAAYTDPDGALGPASGTEGDLGLSELPAPSQTNYVYVRVHNRGERPALDVAVTVFESPVSGVHDPTHWQPIDSTSVDSVPAHGFAVAEVLEWNPGASPMSTLIAVVGVGGEPPVGTAVIEASAQRDWVRRDCRAIAVRSFHTAWPVPTLDADLGQLLFRLPFVALPRRDTLALSFDVKARLLFGSGVGIELPAELADRIPDEDGEKIAVPSRGTVILAAHLSGTRSFGPYAMPDKLPVPMAIVLRRGFFSALFGSWVRVSQPEFASDDEAAQVTFALRPRWFRWFRRFRFRPDA